ncbi:signal peptidase II [Paenarthrobacter nitroguajacolicus]|uniref:Lipoprotein signal peptidase n=1 Tax=Paenarthrobacter nitroguajacolicus TaxID=211146 RepID=A0A558GYS1_PAENT|nr:signal peptidase II [Paenarthrobacter nitroguajacolicus]TVU61986.1 signal peptidase II [Paenarthrobacter nitroguajacolicus]
MSTEPTSTTKAPAGRTSRRIRVLLVVVAAALAAADLIVKAVAETVLSAGATNDLGPINIKLVYNRGVAFSMGAGLPAWAVIAGTGVILAALLWFLLAAAPGMSLLSRAGAALLLGGAAGNFIDRLDGQGVVDYLHTGWFPTFNLADVFVTTGVAVLVLGVVLSPRARPED